MKGSALGLFLLMFFTMFSMASCSRQAITGTEYLTNELPRGKLSVIDISDELRFSPETGNLAVGDSLERRSPVLDQLLHFLQRNGDAKVVLKVSHVYRSKEYREMGLIKSRNLQKYFVAKGIAPSRITYKTFLDRRSKYPQSSVFRKVLVVLSNVPSDS